MRSWDTAEGKTLQKTETNRYRGNGLAISRILGAAVLTGHLVTACDRPITPMEMAPEHVETSGLELMSGSLGDSACGPDSHLIVALYGSIQASINWQADQLSCAGMPRPGGEGARIRLSGSIDTGDEVKTLAFILGLPDLEIGHTGSELPTNVTLIEEGSGRFFGTRDVSGCWTDVTSQDPIDPEDGQAYRIEGTLYCISPLPHLNGNTSVTFTELSFAGRVNWQQPE